MIYFLSTKMKQIIVLNWMPWCWKSTVWKTLSKKIWYTYYDLDDLILSHILKNFLISTISEFVWKYWWDEFRFLESKLLKNLIENLNSDSVISLWWGTISCINNIYLVKNSELLKNSWVKIFYLDTKIDDIVYRVQNDKKTNDNRPIIDSNLDIKSDILQRYNQRKSNYLKYSTHIIDNSSLENSILEITKKIKAT